jgi:hypothetical protein
MSESQSSTASPEKPSEHHDSISEGQRNRWYQEEVRIKDLQSDEDAHSFLDKVIIPNLGSKLGNLRPISEETLNVIQGFFSGHVRFDDDSPPWDVEWRVDGHVEDHRIQGHAVLILAKNGKPFSTSNGTGDLKFFNQLSNQSSAIFVEANSDNYMQLYFLPKLTQLVGNFYRRDNPSERFQKKGTVVLSRKH